MFYRSCTCAHHYEHALPNPYKQNQRGWTENLDIDVRNQHNLVSLPRSTFFITETTQTNVLFIPVMYP